jgi:hypothetical protein
MKRKYFWFLPVVVLGFFAFTKAFNPPSTPVFVEETRSLSSFDSEYKEPKTDGGKYPTTKMTLSSDYDSSHGIVWLTPEQSEKYRVVIKDGKFYDAMGNLYPDTKSSHENHFNYVMDAAGNFFLFNEWEEKTIHHSSIVAGGPVAGAGEIIVKDGSIRFIDSNTGHYRKAYKTFSNVLLELQANGVDTHALEK